MTQRADLAAIATPATRLTGRGRLSAVERLGEPEAECATPDARRPREKVGMPRGALRHLIAQHVHSPLVSKEIPVFSIQCSVSSIQCSVFSVQYSVIGVQGSVFGVSFTEAKYSA